MSVYIRLYILVLLSIAMACGLFAQDAGAVLTDESREVDLAPGLFLFRDPTGQLLPEQVDAKSAEFQPLPKDRVNIGYTADTLWVSFTLRSDIKRKTDWVIELSTAQLHHVDWFLFADGQLLQSQTGMDDDSSVQIHQRYPSFPITIEPNQTVRVSLRVRSTASIVVPLRLYTPSAFHDMERGREWSKGLFFGYVGALAIFGVILAGVIRNRIFLFYALIMACLSVDALCMTGTWSLLGLPGAALMDRQGLLINSILCVALIVVFQRHFFQLKDSLPRLDRALGIFLVLYLGFLLAAAFAPGHLIKLVQRVLEICVYLGTIVLSLYFVMRGFKPARLFFFGWLGFWLLYTFLLLQVLGVLPFQRLSPNLVEIAFATGATFFLLAVAGWVRQIQRENEQSRYRELSLQKEMLIRLEHVVAERTADLRQAKEAAEQANRFKGLFLANISHEIRTPLSALVGLSQAMWMESSKYSLPEEFSQFLNQIRSGGQYLNLMLTNLLNVSAAEAGRSPLHWQEIKLTDWADSIRDLLEPIARNHNVRLAWQRDFPPHCVFDTDFVRLTQILLNIAHNAIKFSKAEQTVEITIRHGQNGLELMVCDEGPGILDADLQTIFRAFSQSNAKSRGSDCGVGLGLSVVQLNVELLCGRVQAENRACGGACFSVTLPNHQSTQEP